jgi:hypothetical protein
MLSNLNEFLTSTNSGFSSLQFLRNDLYPASIGLLTLNIYRLFHPSILHSSGFLNNNTHGKLKYFLGLPAECI